MTSPPLAARRSSSLRHRIESKPVPAPSSSIRMPGWNNSNSSGCRAIRRPSRIAEPHVCTPTQRWSDMGASCSSTGTAGGRRLLLFPCAVREAAPELENVKELVGDDDGDCDGSEGDVARVRRRVKGDVGEVASDERKVCVVGDRVGFESRPGRSARSPGSSEGSIGNSK